MPSKTMRRAVDTVAFGRRRRQRAMHRRLAELDRLEFGSVPLPREPLPTALITLIVAVVVVGGLLALWLLPGSSSHQTSLAAADGARIAPRVLDAPTSTHIDQPHRLLPPVTIKPAARSTSYRFIGGPHGPRWEACRAIHYVVRPGGEGAEFDTILRSAIAEVSRATGLTFVDDGLTTEAPLQRASRDLYQPNRYGNRWAPVLIAWSNVAESPGLGGRVEGFARPGWWEANGEPQRLVSGSVTYDVDKLQTLDSELGHGAVRTVVLHELGHLVGLAHVHDRSQVMNPSLGQGAPTHFAAGDLTGLAELGSGPCFTDY